MAGITCFYNTDQFYYLYISHDEELGKYLGIMGCRDLSGANAYADFDRFEYIEGSK